MRQPYNLGNNTFFKNIYNYNLNIIENILDEQMPQGKLRINI